jgi:hypothetical protein
MSDERPITESCDRCVDHEAHIEALLEQLHDVGVELADARSTLQAYQQHPSTDRRNTLTPLVDACNPQGMKRPKLTVVR